MKQIFTLMLTFWIAAGAVWAQTDAGVSGVTPPASLDCDVFTDGFDLQIQYQNFGTTNLSPNVQVGYSLNGGTPVFENAPALAPGATGNYTFSSSVVLPQGGQTFFLRIFTSVPGDANATNDTLGPIPIPAPQLESLPYLETFANFTVGSPGTLASGWSRTSQTSRDWSVDDGSLNTTINTGPLEDHTPTDDIFVFAESDFGSAGDTLSLISRCIDLGGSTTPRLSFWYHMFGAEMGILRVLVFDVNNNTYTPVFSLAGEQQSSAQAPWKQAQVDLTSFAGNVVQIVYVVELTTTNFFGATSDVAIDDMLVYQPQPLDMGASLVSSPVDSSCFGSNEPATIEITNFGSQPIDLATNPVTLNLEVTGPGGLQTLDTVLNSGTIPVLGTNLITFPPGLDLSTSGSYTFKGFTTLTGDLTLINDTTSRVVISQLRQVAPLIEDFESFNPPPFSGPGTLAPGWGRFPLTNNSGWHVSSGGTPTSLTGPSGNNTAGGSVYLYYESPNSSPASEYTLISPCYDLSGMSNPKLSFFYHMYGFNMGTLEVDVVENGVATNLFSLSGQQQGSNAALWEEVSLDLAPYAGATIQLAFRALPLPTGTRSDMAIDDLNIFEPPAFDALADEITQPLPSCSLTGSETVAVKILNFGSDTLTDIAAQFQVDAGPFTAFEGVPGVLAPGDSVEYIFNALADLSTPGPHTITVVTTSATPADQVPSNDTLSRQVFNFGTSISSFPYFESFETGPAGWSAQAIGTSANTWALGLPSKNVIVGAASGDSAWVTGGLSTGTYSSSEQSFLLTPCFDLSSLTEPVVRMDIWYESETNDDGAVLQYSTDGGSTWQRVGDFGDPNNWYNRNSISASPGGQSEGWSGTGVNGSGGWVRAERELDGLGGVSGVVFRVAFAADNFLSFDGVAIDNFEIFQKPPQNARAFEILSPVSGCGLSAASPIEVAFINEGSAAITSIDLNFQVDTNAVITETLTGNFAPGDTVFYTFTGTANAAAPGIYDVAFWTSLTADTVNVNDSLFMEVKAVPTITQYPYLQDFENGPDFWESGGLNSTWAFGEPDKNVIQGANSGDSAWVTGGLGTGNHGSNERSFVLGPCFDFSALTNPEIRMSIWYESQFSVDGAALQSSVDNGQSWQLVGNLGSGINWYNDNTIGGAPGGQQTGWTGRVNSGNGSGGWLFTQNALSGLGGQSQVQLRVVFGSNASVEDDGFAFDDIVIFDRRPDDVGVAQLSAFPASVCLGDSTELTLALVNHGLTDQVSVPVEVLISGPVNDTLTGTFSNPLATGDTVNFSLGSYTPPQTGSYQITAYTILAGDTVGFHDTARVTIQANTIAAPPVTQNDTLCSAGNAQLTLTADGGGAEVLWLSAATGGRVVGRGDTLQTPTINSTSTFFALNTTFTQDTVGPAGNNFGNGSASTLYNSGLRFDVLQTMVLRSVKVYPTGQGTIVVNLRNAAGTTILSSSFNYGGTGNDTTLTLGWFLEPGLNYSITALGTSISGGGLFRNFTGVQYPYVVEGAINIKSNALNQPSSYDFFYDWRIDVLDCPSNRVPAQAVLLPPISVNLGFDGVQCEGYELDATNPNAVSYLWNDNPTVTTPTIIADTTGSYVVEVENSFGCTDRDTVVLFITPAPEVNATADSSACDSVQMSVAPVSGATYFWLGPNPTNQDRFQTTFTAYQSGNYFVTVSKDGCTARDTISINLLPNPRVDLGADRFSCDTVTLDAGAGSTYLWSNGATTQTIEVLPPLGGVDTLSVLVSNADGCTGSDTVLVQQTNPPVVDLGDDRDVCGDETLNAGNVGSTFDWNTGATTQGITVDSSGVYAVLVTDANGCQGTDTVDIMVVPEPVADATFSLNAGSSTVDFTNNSTPDSVDYFWTFGDGVGNSTEKNPSYSYPVGGTYQATLVVSNDCGSDTITFLVENVPTGLSQNLFHHGLGLFPNPTEGAMTLEAEQLAADEFSIEVTDARGRSVWQRQVSHPGGSFRQFIDLGEVSEGIYLVRIVGQETQGLQRVQVR